LRTPETEDVILSVARTDPSSEVRQQAVFWLSQAGGDRAVTALDSIARGSPDQDLREKAIFALSQIHGPRALQILRDYAARADAPEETRERAIFWLGQRSGPDNASFLRDLYARVGTENLKEKIIFSLSQTRSAVNTRWLLDLALNQSEGIELRKKAIFWAGQSGADVAELVQLYGRTTEREMREQLIFVYSQHRDAAAVDKLIDIARHETDRELRNRAVFWLGQSRDPRAVQALLEIIGQ
jgi:HEAT repeat protein